MDNQEQIRIDVVIPVYHPDASFPKMIKKLMHQTIRPHHIYLMQTVSGPQEALVQPQDERISVHPVVREQFDHGGTRHLGLTMGDSPYVLFMTQDAMPADDHLLERLAEGITQDHVAIAYARQLAREQADIVERMTREHNYPDQDRLQSLSDLETLGIKTYFCSDVCAMYRREIYEQMGGFVRPTIFNEDMIMASRVIGAGYRVAYCSRAQVIHSHSYTCMQQFYRNFDLGASQRQYHEVFDAISSEKTGAGYARFMLSTLLKKGRVFKAFYFALQCGFKLAGFKLGKRFDSLPRRLVLRCSSQKSYWENPGHWQVF